MAQKFLNIEGPRPTNFRDGAEIINENFTELYQRAAQTGGLEAFSDLVERAEAGEYDVGAVVYAAGTPYHYDGIGTSIPALLGWRALPHNTSPFTQRIVLTGDGVTATVELSEVPNSIDDVSVFISGLALTPSVDFTLSGAVITFTSPLPAGEAVLVVVGILSGSLARGGSANADRAALVQLIAGGWVPVVGHVEHAGGVSYRYDGITSTIPDMPGWTWHGQATDRHFGAVGDGSADDASALAAFAAAFDAERAVRPAHWRIMPGRYRMTAGIQFVEPSSPGNYRSTLNWDGAEFVCDYNRAGKSYLIAFGDPAAAGTYQSIIDVEGRVYFSRGAGCTYAPVAVYFGAMAQSTLNGINAGSWDNTIVDMPGIQNVACEDWTIYSGGYSFGYRDMSGSRYRQTGTTMVRVSGADDFLSSDVGKTVEIKQGTVLRRATITALISPTSVEMDYSFTDTIDREIQFGSCAPRTTAGSAVVALDGPVKAEMVGLWAGIPRAGANGKILWGHIVGVSTVAGTITLDRTAGVTLDPATNPTTQTTEIACPVIALRSDLASEGGAFSNGISQVRFLNLQIETYRGVGIGVDDAEFVHFTQCKIHGNSHATWNTFAHAPIWANRLGGTFIGEFDQRNMGIYKMHFANQTFPFNFIDLAVRSKRNEKLMRVQPYGSGASGAVVSFGHLAVLGTDAAQGFADLVVDSNPTAAPGHLQPTRFLKPDMDGAEYSLGRKASVNKDGQLTVTGIRNSGGMVSFTPVLADASTGGNVATGTIGGWYQQVGNLVFVSISAVSINTTGMTAGNNLYIRGLPFPLLGGTFGVSTGAVRLDNVAFTSPPVAWADNGDDYVLLYEQASGGAATPMKVSQITSGSGIIRFSLVYPTGAA